MTEQKTGQKKALCYLPHILETCFGQVGTAWCWKGLNKWKSVAVWYRGQFVTFGFGKGRTTLYIALNRCLKNIADKWGLKSGEKKKVQEAIIDDIFLNRRG